MSLGRHLDFTIEGSEEIRFKQKHFDLRRLLIKTTKFTDDEIDHLMLIYYHVYREIPGAEGLTKQQLSNVLHYGLDLTDYRQMNGIISALDKSTAPYVSIENWINMFSIFLKGTLEEKIEYAYKVCNSLSTSENLLRNTMLKHFQYSFVKETDQTEENQIDDTVKDMVDMLMKKMDRDMDGVITYEDYKETIMECPLLLECFGPCLPTRLACLAFVSTFSPELKDL